MRSPENQISVMKWLCLFLRCRTATCVVLVAALLSPMGASASTLFYGFNNVYSGTGPASTSLPWVTMLFQDMAPGTVSLTLPKAALTGSGFLGEFDFNLNPGLNPTKLQFAFATGSGGFNLPTISTGENRAKADGDGYYDISFGFGTADGTRFAVGDYVTCQITSPGLTAFDFNCLSAPAGGYGPFYAATHVQGIGVGGSNSGWISVTQVTPAPEPGTFAIAVCGLTGLFVM
jgi:hypothetical protein